MKVIKSGYNETEVYYKLEKKGNDITGFYSTDGATWTESRKGDKTIKLEKTSRLDLIAGSGTPEQ